MSVKYNLSSPEAINLAIAKWAGRGKAVKEEGQTIAIGIMEHMEAHGRYTMINNLFDATKVAFGNALQLAMKEFFLKYTWLAYDENKKEFFKDKTKSMNIEGAKKEKWFDIERPARQTPFDFQKAAERLVKQAVENKTNLIELRAYIDAKIEAELAKAPALEVAQQIDAAAVEKALVVATA